MSAPADQTPSSFEAMTHTSTSPNYQILASLDIGRRQVELEGYELVQKQVDHAMALRERIATHSLLKKYFRFLATGDLIPRKYRPSGIESYFDSDQRWARMEVCWHTDEFVVDPTRLTLHIVRRTQSLKLELTPREPR